MDSYQEICYEVRIQIISYTKDGKEKVRIQLIRLEKRKDGKETVAMLGENTASNFLRSHFLSQMFFVLVSNPIGKDKWNSKKSIHCNAFQNCQRIYLLSPTKM